MASCFEHKTTYFWKEGKENLQDCLRLSFEAAKKHDVSKIVIFTGVGEGVKIARAEFTNQPEYADIALVAVTFPHGHTHPSDVSEDDVQWMRNNDIPLVRAHLPFDPIKAQYHGMLGQDLSLLGNVLSIFGGSMSLAVQAVLMACDAGEVSRGEHVIALTSDTSILVRAAPTSHLLTDFIVREIFCKSVFLDISKGEKTLHPSSKPIEGGILQEPKLIEGEVQSSSGTR